MVTLDYSCRRRYRFSSDMGIEAWYMDSSEEDQRKPHRLNPNQPVSLDELQVLGVFYWKVTLTLEPLAALHLANLSQINHDKEPFVLWAG